MEGNVLLNRLLGAQSHYLGPVTAEERSAYVEKLARDVERDYFMTAQEALEYGIIDEVYQPRQK